MRNAQIAGTQQQGEATRVGAFGGSRDAIMRADRERNLATLMNQNQAQGLQGAFQQAQQAQQFGANLGLQGMQAGMQGVGAGINAQQAAYNQAMQGGQQMANLGQQQLAAQQGIYGLQNQFGGQQQALEQQKINQAMQDYANAQQYPLMQLGTMSNMLRGLPMQASTTNQYQAAPNQLSQAIGTIGSGASIYNAFKGASGGLPSEFKYAKGGGIMSYDMGGEVESQLENMSEQQLAEQAKESSSPSIRRMAQRILRERQMSKQGEGASAMGIQYQAPQAQMPAMRGGGIIAFAKGDTVYGGPSSEAKEGEEDARGIDKSGRTMDQRLAMPPTTGGILGASPVTAAPTTQVPSVPSPDVVQEAMRQRDLFSAQANKSRADVIKEIKAEQEASGIGENVGRQEYRSQMMAERANMKDEQERQRHMRLAEFFANWGSTPGPVLVAGMNALKQSIPNIISDEKEQKKARKEADKIIYDIDEATRLEKLGLHDKADARIQQAGKHAEEYNKYLLTFQSQRESDKRALDVANIQSAASKYTADTHAKSQGAAAAQRGQEASFYHVETNLNNAYKNLGLVQQQIEATKQNPKSGYTAAQENISMYQTMLKQADGDVSKIPERIKQLNEKAVKDVEKFDASANARLKEAQDRVKTADIMFQNYGRAAKDIKSGAVGLPGAPSGDNPLGLEIPPPASSAAPANAPAATPSKASTSRTGDASSANPYVDTKGKALPNAPRGEPSKASKLADEVAPVVKNVANKVAEELSGSELRYLKDKIARNEKLSVTDRIRAERAGLL